MDWSRLVSLLRVVCIALTAAAIAYGDLSSGSTAPAYTAATILHGATQTNAVLAPNVIATIYGKNLCWTTRAVTTADVINGAMPTVLDGVTVYVNNIPSGIFYVSPTQINFLVPYEQVAGDVTVIVVRQSVAGPPVTLRLADVSPGIFEWNGNQAIATHSDGATLVTFEAPARRGEVLVFYVTGLGRTVPDTPAAGRIPTAGAWIVRSAEVRVLFGGVPTSKSDIWYAGLTPGCAGLYQINVRVPEGAPPNPDVQILIGSQLSPVGVILPLQ